MYVWIWRSLRGPMWARLLQVAALLAVLVFVLFQWVYPWLAPLLPFQQQTVEG